MSDTRRFPNISIMLNFFGGKKAYKILLITSLVLLVIGSILLNGSRHSTAHRIGSDDWAILDGWTAPPELDGNKDTCEKLLKRMKNNSSLEFITLGIGGTIRLVDVESSASEHQNEMRKDLTAFGDLFKSCDMVQALSSLAGADKMGLGDINAFLSRPVFELLRELGVSSLPLAVPELRHEGFQQGIPEAMRAASSAGIHLTGVAASDGREQPQPVRLLTVSKGKRVGVLSYCAARECEEGSGLLAYPPALYAPVSPHDIQLLRAKGASVVVVTVNWGPSRSYEQYREVVNHQLARSGADVIVGQLPNGKHVHGLFGTTLVINSAEVMSGRGIMSNRSGPDTQGTALFLFYRVLHGLLGGRRFEYTLLDGKDPRDRREWVEVCSSRDVYCVDCVTYW